MRCCNFNLTGLSYRCLPNGLGEMGSADVSMHFDEQHWSPAYWERHHRALLDVCEQIGAPHLFVTVAPREWSFLFPCWIGKARAAARAGPTELSGAEVLAVAHGLHQICAGFLCGASGDAHRWKDHLQDNKVGAFGGAQAHVARYEYQDGGKYHEFGKVRGSLYVHMLLWLHGAPQVHPE